MIDIAKLKTLTAEAIQRKKEQEKQKELLNKKRLEDLFLENQKKAKAIIDEIPEKAEKAALKGENFLVVISKLHSDRDEELQGAEKMVYDYCSQHGLNPKIEDWHDGVGFKSGRSLVISW